MHDGIVDMFNFDERNSQFKIAKHILIMTNRMQKKRKKFFWFMTITWSWFAQSLLR